MKLSTTAFLVFIFPLTMGQMEHEAYTKTLKQRLMDFRAEQFVDHQMDVSAIREHHERRMERLEGMIEERRRLVEEHESGRRKLSSDEFDRASTQVRNFERKLNAMKETNTDGHHYERMEDYKSLHSMNDITHLEYPEHLEGM